MAYTDAFTGTNGTLLPAYNAVWVNIGDDSLQITSNTAGPSAGGFCSNLYNGTFADKHYAKATILSGNYIGPAIRMSSSQNYYYCFASLGDNSFIGEVIAGSATDWDSGQATVSASDVVEIGIDPTTSTTVLYKVNTVTIATYTGKSTLTGGKAGVAAYGSGSGYIDNFEAGDVGGGAVTVSLSTASLTAGGQALSINAPAPGVSITLGVAGITAGGQALSINAPSPITISLSTAAVDGGGEAITIGSDTLISMSNAAIEAQGQSLTLSPGAVAKAMATASDRSAGLAIAHAGRWQCGDHRFERRDRGARPIAHAGGRQRCDFVERCIARSAGSRIDTVTRRSYDPDRCGPDQRRWAERSRRSAAAWL